MKQRGTIHRTQRQLEVRWSEPRGWPPQICPCCGPPETQEWPSWSCRSAHLSLTRLDNPSFIHGFRWCNEMQWTYIPRHNWSTSQPTTSPARPAFLQQPQHQALLSRRGCRTAARYAALRWALRGWRRATGHGAPSATGDGWARKAPGRADGNMVPACPGMVRGTMGQKLAYYHQEDLGHKCEDSDLWDGSTLLIFSDLQWGALLPAMLMTGYQRFDPGLILRLENMLWLLTSMNHQIVTLLFKSQEPTFRSYIFQSVGLVCCSWCGLPSCPASFGGPNSGCLKIQNEAPKSDRSRILLLDSYQADKARGANFGTPDSTWPHPHHASQMTPASSMTHNPWNKGCFCLLESKVTFCFRWRHTLCNCTCTILYYLVVVIACWNTLYHIV